MSVRTGAVVLACLGLAGAAWLAGCGGSGSNTPPGPDAGTDANVIADTGSDTGSDAGPDASDSGDAGCGDVATSAKNCGVCGHDCLSGACTAGVCGSFVLASATVDWLEADDTAAYYLAVTGVSPQPLYRAALAGGAPQQLGTNKNGFQLGHTATSVIGLGATQDFVALAKDGSSAGVPAPLGVTSMGVNTLIAGGGKYATMATPGVSLQIVDQTTGAISTFTDGNGSFFAFGLVGTAGVYVLSGPSALSTVPLPPPADGALPAPQTLGFAAMRCAVGGPGGSLLVCSTTTSIVSVPLATPTVAPTTVRSPADVPVWPSAGYPRALAADATLVSWYEATTDAIVTCPLAGCVTPRLMAAGVGDAALVALTSKAVVYYDATKKEIRAIAR